MKRIITIDRIRAGQPKPYADSVYEAVLTFNYEGPTFCEPPENLVKQMARVLVHDWVEEEQGDWASPRLETFEKLDRGMWRVIIVDPYKD